MTFTYLDGTSPFLVVTTYLLLSLLLPAATLPKKGKGKKRKEKKEKENIKL